MRVLNAQKKKNKGFDDCGDLVKVENGEGCCCSQL